jgi:tellurite resistance protein
MQDYQEAMVKSLVAVAWADGRIENEEAEVIDALLSAFEITGDDAKKIREYAKTRRTLEDIPLTDLSANDRRFVLQQAVLVTYIDGKQTDDEVKILNDLAKKLHIPEDEAKMLLEVAEQRAKRFLDLL